MLWIFLSLLVIGITVIYILLYRMDGGEEKVLSKLEAKGVHPVPELLSNGTDTVSVRHVGNPNNPKVLLIHGSPGNWSAWENILADEELRKNYFLVAIDRPGYGKTTIPAQANLEEQRKAASRVFDHFGPQEHWVIVGHSYGGAVVEQLLLDDSDRIKHAVWAGPTLGPTQQKPKWYNHLVGVGVINVTMPNGIQSSNVEMMGLQASLQRNEERLKEINKPVIYIQGSKDVLVPAKTMDYIKSHAGNTIDYRMIQGMNHFVPWSNPELIINAIKGE